VVGDAGGTGVVVRWEQVSDVDGAPVGGASLKADSFLKLVHHDRP
jgi:triosephosphate isomerase